MKEFIVGDLVETRIWGGNQYEVVVYVGSEGVLLHRVNNLIKHQLERYVKFTDFNCYHSTVVHQTDEADYITMMSKINKG